MSASMSRFRRAFLTNIASSSGATTLRFVVSLLLARLLTPAEVGVFAIALVGLEIANVLRDIGVSAYLQREPDLTPAKIASAFGLLCLTTGLVALLMWAASVPLGRLYADPALPGLIQWLALGLLPVPFNHVMSALLLRDLSARRIAAVSLLGTAVQAITAVGLAARGHGAMSLAWAHLANIAACSLAYAAIRPAGLSWWPSLSHLGEVARFGRGAWLSNLVLAVHNALPELLLGRLASSHLVGLYGRASATVNLFTALTGTATSFGALPHWARQHQLGVPIGPGLAHAAALLTGLGWPALALTALFGQELVSILYGAPWLAGVPAIPALALLAGLGLLFTYSTAALTAIGRPALAALPPAATAVGRLLALPLLFSGDLSSCAWALLAGSVPGVAMQFWLLGRHIGLSPAALLAAVRPSLLASAACALAAGAVAACLPPETPSAATLLLSLLPALAAWYATLRWSHHPLGAELHGLAAGLTGLLRITIRK